MDKKDLLKKLDEAGVVFRTEDLERWGELYQSYLIEELYALHKALFVLAYINSKEDTIFKDDFPLICNSGTLRKSSDRLVDMACMRHGLGFKYNFSEDGKREEYVEFFKKTGKDFFGGLYLKDLACTLYTLADLMENEQDQQG